MNFLPLPRFLRRSSLPAALLFSGLSATALHAEETPSPAPVAATTPAFASPLLSRDEAMVLALRRNQRIRVSDFDRGIGKANVLAEYGRFDPAITFKRSYAESEYGQTSNLVVSQLTKTDDYSLGLEGLMPWGLSYWIGGSSENERYTSNKFTNNFVTFGGVSVTQPLLRGFGFGATLVNLRIAKASRAISDWEYRQTVIDVVTNTILAYDNLAEARAELSISRRSRELVAQLVRDNERRNQVGSISDADVTQARARLANREEAILVAERAVKDLENRLRQLIGDARLAFNGPTLPVDELAPAPLPPTDGAADLRHALELRPDYQAAKWGLAKYRAGDVYARNQMLPKVDFVGSFGYNGVDPDFARSRNQVRDQDHRAYSAGVVVSVPLTFTESRGKARAARLTLRQAEADLERLEQDIAISVAAAIGQIETTAKRVEATTRAYELAQQALDAEQKRFKTGTSSTFVVLQLQDQLASVQASQVRAIGDQRRAVANYQREIGITLAVHNLKLD